MGINSSKKKCIFCGYKRTEDIVFQNDNVVLFKDLKPMARYHFLCIPVRHIKNINYLTQDDIPLLEEMKQTAIDYFSENLGIQDIILGFHYPPWTSINHLHLHCIVLPYKNLYYKYINECLMLRSYDKVIFELQNKKNN